jgi:tripartite motif-containing protein 2/3
MCDRCRDEHLENPEYKNHEVVLYQLRKRQLPVEKCTTHPTKDTNMLCGECQVTLCSECATQKNHRGHKFIDLETVYADKIALCLDEISKVEKYFLPASQDLQKEIKGDATEIKMIMESIRAAIKGDGESLKSLVDTVVSENMQEADNIEQSLLEKLQSQDTTFDDYISYLNEHLKELYGYLSSSNLSKLFPRFSNKFPTILPIPGTAKPVIPEFTGGQYSKGDVSKLLGKISNKDSKPEKRKIKPMEFVSPSTSKESPSKQTKQDEHKKSDVKQTLSLSTFVTEVRKFKVNDVHRTFHMSLDKSGRLWASDIDDDLFQTDLQGNQLQKIQSSGGYGYHTVTQDGELIFADRDKKVIKKITKDDKITELIKTTGWFQAWTPISIHSSHINGEILVGMVKDGEARVTQYNKTGKELQNIHRDNKGQGLYVNPHYIAENINGDICVSDYDKQAVVVVNKSGYHRFSYTGQGSRFSPYGICTDVLGQILVCNGSLASADVYVIDKDGRFLSRLLTPRWVYCPYSVCVDDENNLYVGQYLTNTVTVYKYLQ